MSSDDLPLCIFCEIVAGAIPATIVRESENAVAMRDIAPVGPTHVLVIPRRHIPDLTHLGPDDAALLSELIDLANAVAREEGIAASGFRIVANVGDDAGNTVDHLHLHLIGGRDLAWPPG